MPTQPEGPRITNDIREMVRKYRARAAAVESFRAKSVFDWTAEEGDAMRTSLSAREIIAAGLVGAVGSAIDSYDAEQAKQSVA